MPSAQQPKKRPARKATAKQPTKADLQKQVADLERQIAKPEADLAPPADLDSRAKKQWQHLVHVLMEDPTSGFDAQRDMHAVERFVRTCAIVRGMREEMAKTGTLIEGSQGQLVANPLIRRAQEAERDAAKYAADLLLTPKARQTGRATVAPKGSEGDDPIDDLVAQFLTAGEAAKADG